MSLVIPAFATSVDLTVPATGVVSAFSQGAYSVLAQNSANANVPPTWSVLAQVPAGAPTYASSAFASGAIVRIDASGGSPVSVDVGLTPSPKLGRADTVQGVTVNAQNTAATLTTAQIGGGVLTSSGSGIALTLPTGAVMDTQGVQGIGEMFLWSLVSTGGTVTLTAAASGHTITGSGAAAINVSARFGTLKTAAATYTTIRLS